MPTPRRETTERKTALLRDLRLAYHQGAATPGEMALSQRELSAKYGLSMRTVGLELQKLVAEGVLYTVPRVGTFVGQPVAARDNLFLAIFRYLDAPNIQWAAVRAGFEERIAALGGTSLVLDYETARRYHASDQVVAPAGVFELHDLPGEAIWSNAEARVEFGEVASVHAGCDAIYFDNQGGGERATRHLLALGHRKIAFLALHAEHENPGFFLWSQQRENGWRRALQEAGASAQGLAFRPQHTPDVDTAALHQLSWEVAAQLLERDDVTAVVAVNAIAAHGLFQQLRARNLAPERWPAVVSFDTEIAQLTDDAMHVVTTLRLPWEEIGREAANLLWESSQKRADEPQQKLVPMTLIPRLSCRQEWHRAPDVFSSSRQLTAVA